MELNEAIALIQYEGITQAGSAAWADLGCGSGLFTYALSGLLAPDSVIYAIDKEPVTLKNTFQPEGITIKPLQLDFVTNELPLQHLDGILMANSLHYVSDQLSFINKMGGYLKENGAFLVVEYDTDAANPWVPYPLSYHTLIRLFNRAGYTVIKRLQEHASVYGRAKMYAVWISKS